MKRNYVKPQIVQRNVSVKYYMLGQSQNVKTGEVLNNWYGTGDHAQLTKDRDDIWGNSDSDEESIW